MSYTGAFSKSHFRLIYFVVTIAIALMIALSATNSVSADVASETNVFEYPVAPEGQAQSSEPDSNLEFLFAVFIITWAAFFGYMFYMSRRQREMRKEIDILRRALVDRERRMMEAESGSE